MMSQKLKLLEIITDVFKTILKCLTFNMKSERKLLLYYYFQNQLEKKNKTESKDLKNLKEKLEKEQINIVKNTNDKLFGKKVIINK